MSNELLVYKHPDGRKMRIRPNNPTSHASLIAQGFVAPSASSKWRLATYELQYLDGIGAEIMQALSQIGIVTVKDLQEASDTTLLAVPGIGPKKLAHLREQLP